MLCIFWSFLNASWYSFSILICLRLAIKSKSKKYRYYINRCRPWKRAKYEKLLNDHWNCRTRTHVLINCFTAFLNKLCKSFLFPALIPFQGQYLLIIVYINVSWVAPGWNIHLVPLEWHNTTCIRHLGSRWNKCFHRFSFMSWYT